jgi:hypothetical protein
MSKEGLDAKLNRLSEAEQSASMVEMGTEPRRQLLERLGRFSYIAPAIFLVADPANAIDDYKDKPKDKPRKV